MAPADDAMEPDVMNDPAFERNATGKEKSMDEPDTCRICRGEGSKEEPLFYPCKCSGSIKFVHQACLMEWLSHSQKKHCELCKTAFRFTKLYDPHMPKTVPLPIFLRQATIHTLKSIMTWTRWHLVAFVWLGWVPWCMRTVWRGLFWIGDGGWADWKELERKSSLVRIAQLELDKHGLQQVVLDQLNNRASTPIGQSIIPSDDTAASDVLSRIFGAFPSVLLPVSRTLNFTAGEPTLFRIAKRMARGLMYYHSVDNISQNATMSNSTGGIGFSGRSPSWLSELTLLRNLTRWRTINNVIIDVLEGQLITLCVCITFILIFLIREWVVQQQPGINMGGALNAIPAVNAPVARPEAPLAPAQVENRPEPVDPTQDTAGNQNNVMQPADIAEHANRGARGQGSTALPSAFNASNQEFRTAAIGDATFRATSSPGRRRSINDAGPGPSNSVQRPGTLTRENTGRAIEIRRALDEQSRTSVADWPGREIFMDLWKRSGANPREVLRIISEEGRDEELAWIVSAMKKREAATVNDRALADSQVAQHTSTELEDSSSGENSVASNESWQVIGGASDQQSKSATTKSFDVRDVSKEIAPSQMPQENSLSGDDIPDFASNLDKGKGRQEYPENEQGRINASTSQRRLSPQYPFVDVKAQVVSDYNLPDPIDDEDDGIITQPLDDLYIPLETNRNDADDASSTEEALSLPSTDLPEPVPIETSEAANRPEVPRPINNQRNIRENVIDWLWGGVNQVPAEVEDPGAEDEHVVDNIAEEPPLVPLVQNQLVIAGGNNAENQIPDPEVLRAAVEAGVNPNEVEVIEDGEDLEGIMELIGMQGPLAGLVQNGMFCAVLISMTVFFGIWLPYIAGKLFLVFLANPVSLLVKLPLRWASIFADLVIDTCVFGAACAFYWVDTIIRYSCVPVGWLIPPIAEMNQQSFVGVTAKNYAGSALERLAKMFVATGDTLSDSDIPVFSIIAHESLLNIENRLVNTTNGVMDMTIRLSQTFSSEHRDSSLILRNVIRSMAAIVTDAFTSLVYATKATVASVPGILSINPLRLSLDIPQRTQPLDYSLAEWSTKDRVLAVALGYLAFSIAGTIYVKMRIAFRDRGNGDKFEGPIADALFQAGGVMKVILIISIEMIAFPLYCGMLLDVALLPLFENASLVSRLRFTLNSPATSLFIHWFVGTCYMFHFALFVSMCRKIMRRGVLYFIRDPDDPTFHPVRDVLERNVSTQLRKIAFSALVYGALVIICLGTVVWGLSFAAPGVFPIHWSSNEPILEFPVDLLFYNFLMPLVVKFFRPSEGLRVMYGWWFRKCARVLRLTEFLFGEEKMDEQGHWVYRTWWRSIMSKQHLATPTPQANGNHEFEFIRDGQYVRAPASDQVRIPKGARTFVVVDENNKRVDGAIDTDQGLHGSKNPMFAKVYIPPSFYFRISTFIFLIWLFAATTGVGLTIVPLIFGRFIFAHLIPPHLRMNDIYAFSIGIYLLGGPLYLAIRYRSTLSEVFQKYHSRFSSTSRSAGANSRAALPLFLRTTASYLFHVVRLFYIYTAFTLLLPSLFALLMELYLIIPLHTYFSTTSTATAQSLSGGQGNALADRHTIHFIQDWTLGVLYIKMGARLILWNRDSRPARALRAIIAPPFGWLDPNVRLATRAFIFPATLFMLVAITAPLCLGYIANNLFFNDQDALVRACVYRYSYPGLLGIGLAGVFAMRAKRAVSGWRTRVRDEVYLIGERLHNFGERRDAVSSERGPNDTMPTRTVVATGAEQPVEDRPAFMAEMDATAAARG